MLPSSLLALVLAPPLTPSQNVDLYLPRSTTKPPALVVFIHGGAWISGDKREYVKVAERFTALGYAFAAVNYRLSNERAVVYPVHATDCASAIAWLIKSGKGFDKTRVFVAGHSAGAHISATLATSADLWRRAGVPTRWRPAGYIGLEGIYDVAALDRRWPAYRSWFLARAFGDPAGYASASPTLLRNQDRRPWLVIHSRADELVDLGQSRDFASGLRKQGVPVRLIEVPGKSHSEVINGWGIKGDPATKATLEFLGKPVL